jgi:hypothetical protein
MADWRAGWTADQKDFQTAHLKADKSVRQMVVQTAEWTVVPTAAEKVPQMAAERVDLWDHMSADHLVVL